MVMSPTAVFRALWTVGVLPADAEIFPRQSPVVWHHHHFRLVLSAAKDRGPEPHRRWQAWVAPEGWLGEEKGLWQALTVWCDGAVDPVDPMEVGERLVRGAEAFAKDLSDFASTTASPSPVRRGDCYTPKWEASRLGRFVGAVIIADEIGDDALFDRLMGTVRAGDGVELTDVERWLKHYQQTSKRDFTAVRKRVRAACAAKG